MTTFRAKAASVAVAALLLLTACTTALKPIESVTFHQFQSIPDFDSSDYTQTDPAELDRLRELFERFAVTPGQTVTTIDDECTGGLSTTFTVAFTDGSSADMFVANCGRPEHSEFNSAANALFTQWREALSLK